MLSLGRGNLKLIGGGMNLDRTLHGAGTLKPSLGRHFQEPLCEQDILYLQKQFLISGFHNLHFKDMKLGRQIIFKILKSLNCYKNVAYVSRATLSNFPKSMINLNYVFSDYKENEIYDFLVEQFDFDFMFIEVNKNELTLLTKIQNHFVELNIHKLIPIIFLIEN